LDLDRDAARATGWPVSTLPPRAIDRSSQLSSHRAEGAVMPIHDAAFRLAVDLLRGTVLEFTDGLRRHWKADRNGLYWRTDGKAAPILEGCAADVAIEVLKRWPERIEGK
jgi:hypothetical protein